MSDKRHWTGLLSPERFGGAIVSPIAARAQGRPVIVAYWGEAAAMPENTPAAFDFASRLGVRNVSDRLPPRYLRDTRTTPQQTAGNNTSNAYYNAICRYFFVKGDANF